MGVAMQIGYVCLTEPGATDLLLMQVADMLAREGFRLAGAVQDNIDRPDRAYCDMHLRLLPDGPQVRISEDRGTFAQGCRLDAGALEQAAARVMDRLAGAELLIVNKFGKREAEGRGLIPAIIAALDTGVPVLAGVNSASLPALQSFTGGIETALPPDPEQVARWCRALIHGTGA